MISTRFAAYIRHLLLILLGIAVAVAPLPAQSPADPAAESELEAQAGPKKHQKRQKRPVRMGTSGGNINDFTFDPPFILCCSGTLGGVVRKDDRLFVLSNNHVLAQLNQARRGDAISQPGLIDARCDSQVQDFVAELTDYKRLKRRGRNKVDAAIAEILDDSVDVTGEIIGVGVPGNEPLDPQVGLAVQKSGRTTGLRRGIVQSLNNTVRVEFPLECSEDAQIVLIRFVNQFFVVSEGRKDFSAGGDSGSLILEDVKSCPRPVGLLFAGNDFLTAGNPIGQVMKEVDKMRPGGKAELVGCSRASGAELRAKSALPGLDERRMRLAKRIQARTEDAMFELPGVHAMGIGLSSSKPDTPVFMVYVDPEHGKPGTRFPRELDGIEVEVVETARLRALGCARSVQAVK